MNPDPILSRTASVRETPHLEDMRGVTIWGLTLLLWGQKTANLCSYNIGNECVSGPLDNKSTEYIRTKGVRPSDFQLIQRFHFTIQFALKKKNSALVYFFQLRSN